MENTELMVTNQNLYVAPVVGIEEAKSKFEMVRKYTADCLKKGVDYGSFQGVAKPSLLKPGAEKICSLFGLTAKFKQVDKVLNWTGEGNPDNEPFFYFEYKCELFRGGEFVGSCDGSCNSWEKKYRYRKGELTCPNCGKPLRKSKNNDGFYCWTKAGGCGAQFQSNDTRITSQKVGDVKNFDTAEQVNTFQKMAQKRAYIGATLIACNLSEYYTQDIEDMDSRSYIPEQPTTDVPEAEYSPVLQTTLQPQKPAQVQKPQFDEVEFLRNWNEKSTVIVCDKAIALPEISLEMACDIDTTNKDGSVVKMGKRSVGQLAGMWKAYKNRLNDPELTNFDDVLMRLSAVNQILTAKAQAQTKLDNIQ